jgi:dUTP pyrophosphatase
MLRICKLSENAITPTRGSDQAAGLDLYSASTIEIAPKQKALVSTGLAIECPYGTYGRIAPRSGLAVKYFIDVGAGVIDSDYRGDVEVLLFNLGNKPFKVQRGDRIAQLIIERIMLPEIEIVDVLCESKRGENGFGSSNIDA